MATASEIDVILREAVASGAAQGIAAAAGTADQVLYRGAAGTRDGRAPMTADSIFWIASMTKLITAVAALQQVERGRLSLDQPLGDLLPDLKDLRVLVGFEADGRDVTRPATTALTLRHLLAHTGGWAYDLWNADVLAYQQLHDVPGTIACVTRTLHNPLVADPGTAWEYGPHHEWIGRVVEHVSGMDLDRYLREEIFAPLGMADTVFVIGERRERLVQTVARNPAGGFVPVELEVPQDPEYFWGGGGIYSSPDDYLKLLRMLLAGGELDGRRILDADTITQAATNQIGELEVGRITSTEQAVSLDVEFLPGVTKKWSLLGLLNVEQSSAGRSPGSLFWAGTPNTYFWVDWQRGVAGVFCTQLLPFTDPAVTAALDRFERAVGELAPSRAPAAASR